MSVLRRRPNGRRALAGWFGGLLALAVVLASGCGGPAGKSKGRVLLIGLDGVDWHLLKPLIDAGRMPHIKSLVDRGVAGDLRSLEPLQKSPAIWTTIATGKPPEEHGIRSFVDEVEGRPLTQNIRRVKALWNIASSAGKTVGVVGWLMSWPAEQVNGFVVSDYIQYQAARTGRMEHRTYPPELYDEIEPLNHDWKEMSWDAVSAFLSRPVTAEADSAILIAARPIQWMITADKTFTDIALKLGKERNPDFLAVYLRSTDTMAHLYWNYQHPESWPPGTTDPALEPYFKDTMAKDYEWVDEQVGRMLDALADENTTVVICSDHGFVGGGHGGVRDHRVEGVLIMAGKGIAKGEISGASVYDLTPTLLAIMGLPKADDMKGKVLWQAFDATIRPEMFTEKLPTYESGDAAGQDGLESPVDKELMERLRSLGYIK